MNPYETPKTTGSRLRNILQRRPVWIAIGLLASVHVILMATHLGPMFWSAMMPDRNQGMMVAGKAFLDVVIWILGGGWHGG